MGDSNGWLHTGGYWGRGGGVIAGYILVGTGGSNGSLLCMFLHRRSYRPWLYTVNYPNGYKPLSLAHLWQCFVHILEM